MGNRLGSGLNNRLGGGLTGRRDYNQGTDNDIANILLLARASTPSS